MQSKIKFERTENKTVEFHCDKNGVLDYKVECEYKYDKKGNIVLENYLDDNGEVTAKIKYKYDAKGNKIFEASYHGKVLGAKVKYDKHGNAIYESSHDENGFAVWKTRRKYKYDDLGNPSRDNLYNGFGFATGKCEYEYTNPRVIYTGK